MSVLFDLCPVQSLLTGTTISGLPFLIGEDTLFMFLGRSTEIVCLVFKISETPFSSLGKVGGRLFTSG